MKPNRLRCICLAALSCAVLVACELIRDPLGRQATPDPLAWSLPTVAITPLPLPSPTPAPSSPTETASPVQVPAVEPSSDPFTEALEAAEDGAWERVIALLEPQGDALDAPFAMLLARAYREQDRIPAAMAQLERAVEVGADEKTKALALAQLADLHEVSADWEGAIRLWDRYLTLDDSAEPYIRWHMAKDYISLDDAKAAVEQLSGLDLSTLPAPKRAEILEDLAAYQRKIEEGDDALATYEQILGFAKLEGYRATILYKEAETLLEQFQQEEAIARLNQILETYPDTYGAYLALMALDDLGAAEQVSYLQRGRVLYAAGQYDEAIVALQNYINQEPETGLGAAHYYLAQALATQGRQVEAFESFELAIEHAGDQETLGKAWMSKAQWAEAYGGDPSGIYREFWRLHPQHPLAPQALWKGGQAQEARGEWAGARELYGLLRANYPQDELAFEARFREGLAAYALEQPKEARALWGDALARFKEAGRPAEEQARLHTWMGLAADAEGDRAAAERMWREAVRIAPESYYGLRAYDLLHGIPTRLPAGVPTVSLDDALQKPDWTALQMWVQSWYTGTAPSGEEALPPAARLGLTLYDIGWESDGLQVLRQSLEELKDDPLALLELANEAVARHIYPVSVGCAERIAQLAEEKGQEIPQPLRKLAHPLPYARVIMENCQRLGIDPLLLWALMRQESRFYPRAVSSSGAIGLTQVMPSTGYWIASRLGQEPFNPDLLYRPLFSIRFGSWYLYVLLDLYERDWMAALTAYNAGPGNLKSWTGDELIRDHDLFYETIPLAEPKSYVQQVYQQYRAYRALYAR